MHKSIGNTYLLSQLEEWGYDPLAFRLLALGVGYRKPLDFTRAGMDAAQNRLVKWRRTIAEACVATGGRMTEPEPDFGVRAGFVNALADDFNTPRAVAAAEMALDLAGSPDLAVRERALWLLFDMDRVLGLSLRDRASAADDLSVDEERLFDERERARESGDYAKSDQIRADLLTKYGIQLKDTKEGTRWERVRPKGA